MLIRQMVKDANDIYAQVGVTLNLVEPIVVTNIPSAYDALFNATTNATQTWTFDQIVDLQQGTGGLECYFINSFVDSDSTKAGHNPFGIVVTSKASRYTLAHEIGHAFGMEDIYITNDEIKDTGDPLVKLLDNELASLAKMSGDWNGGCDGKGYGGTRYYRAGTSMKEIVGRMMMLGLVGANDERRDITNGDVHGVHYTSTNNVKTWHKGKASVGFPWTERNPTHQ